MKLIIPNFPIKKTDGYFPNKRKDEVHIVSKKANNITEIVTWQFKVFLLSDLYI